MEGVFSGWILFYMSCDQYQESTQGNLSIVVTLLGLNLSIVVTLLGTKPI